MTSHRMYERCLTHIRPATSEQLHPTWNVWALFFVDNDLSVAAQADLAEIRSTGTAPGTVLIGQTDSAGEFGHELFRAENLPTGMRIRREEITKPKDYRSELGSFLRRAKADSPALDHRFLVIRGHGDGFGIEADGNTWLKLSTIREQILSGLEHDGDCRPLSILAFDACLMANLEAAVELSDTAEILIASQVEEPAEGYPYGAMLRRIQGGLEPAQVTQALQEEFARHEESQRSRGPSIGLKLSAVNLRGVESAAQMMNELGSLLVSRWDAPWEGPDATRPVREHLSRVRSALRNFSRGDFVDILGLLRGLDDRPAGPGPGSSLEKGARGEILRAVDRAAEAIRECLCWGKQDPAAGAASSGPASPAAATSSVGSGTADGEPSGLSIWFPRDVGIYCDDNPALSRRELYASMRFNRREPGGSEGGWLSFLGIYHQPGERRVRQRRSAA